MKNLYKIQDELYIVSDKEKLSYCIKECPMAGLNIDRCDCQIFTACSNKVGNIILTTNKSLIKDGVQAIDDEFLEWFVKNPSCEEVEVIPYLKDIINPLTNEKFPAVQHRYFDETKMIFKYHYKIIIPKTTQEIIDEDFSGGLDLGQIIPKEEAKKIFDLPIATNLGSALTETMKSVSQHEGGIKQGEINLPNFKEEVCTCTTDECLGYLTKKCKRIEEPKQDLLHKCTCLQPKVNCFSGMCSYCNRQIVKNLTTEDLKQKQETLEEVAERFSKQFLNNGDNSEFEAQAALLGVKFGAKWQSERMYSEEEVLKFTQTILMQYKFGNTNIEQLDLLKETLQQLKKK